MAYRNDIDLEFLGEMKSEDLGDLVYCLTHDKNGKARWTEELTGSRKYKMYYPDHQQYWQEIAAEIQCFGADTFATIFRGGKGVLYREVLTDVCDKLKVNYHEKSSVERIELALLSKILEDALNKMTQEQLKEIASELGVNNVEMMSKGALAAVIIKIFNFGGFYSYQLTVIIVNAILKALIGRGLSILGNTILVRILSIITGPIGLVVTGIWTAVDIAGAAYRVTIPAVIAVAALRQKHLYGDMGGKIFDK